MYLYMKKFLFYITTILACAAGMKTSAQAYTVTVQRDGMYAEAIPDTIVDNAPALFQKSLKKALKYDKKYKDADLVTRANNIPSPYDQFIDIAKQVNASDKIVIRNPFCIYSMWNKLDGEGPSEYYFTAVKNGEKLCYFSLKIDEQDQKLRFSYDKSMDQYFKYDEKTMKSAVFYEIDFVTYAQTPDQIYELRDQKDRGSLSMTAEDQPSLKKATKEFKQKTYQEKKDEIFAYLKENKKSGISKKTAKNLKLELKDDYVETESDRNAAGIRKVIYPLTGAVCIVVIVVVFFFVRKRKKDVKMGE